MNAFQVATPDFREAVGTGRLGSREGTQVFDDPDQPVERGLRSMNRGRADQHGAHVGRDEHVVPRIAQMLNGTGVPRLACLAMQLGSFLTGS